MSENINPDPKSGDPAPGNNPGDSNPANPGEPKTVSFDEFETMRRQKDWAAGKLRTMQDEFEQLKTELTELKAGKGKKPESNDEAVRTINELKAQLQSAQGEIRNATVRSEIRNRADGKLVEGGFEALWRLEGDRFDVVEQDGAKKVVIKGAEWMSLDEYFRDEVPKRYPYLTANQRANGTGEPNKGPVNSGEGSSLPKNWSSFSQSQKEEYFRNMTPEQKKEFRKAAGLPG